MTFGLFIQYESTSDFNSHAHVERDVYTVGINLLSFDFNSHAHVERDQVDMFTIFVLVISTHTLTWSVTPVFSLNSFVE